MITHFFYYLHQSFYNFEYVSNLEIRLLFNSSDSRNDESFFDWPNARNSNCIECEFYQKKIMIIVVQLLVQVQNV